MRRHLPNVLTVAAAVAITSLVPSRAQDPATIPVEANGAAGGTTPAMVLNGWDIRGVRNIQGGSLSSDPASLNLDIGAGSTANPGDIALNYDVGRNVFVYDGRKRLLARFGPSGITFYVRPRMPRAYPSWKWRRK